MATPKKSKAKKNSNNSTGYHGVTRDSKGRYVAQIFHKFPGDAKGKTLRLLVTKNVVEAAKAYDAKAVELKGEKAKLNFPTAA